MPRIVFFSSALSAILIANANIAAFMALLAPGDRVLSLPIKSGGHLSHGLKPNFSGTFYDIVEYGLDPKTELLDYDAIRRHPKIFVGFRPAELDTVLP